MDDDITIRLLHNPDELEAVVDLQRIYWGDDGADLVTGHMLLSIVRYGGHVHAAFDGERMIGVLVGFLGADIDPEAADDASSRMLIMSKRMVVLPEYRGQKIGERLKLAQYQYAQRHNIQLVTWTFDPVLARNAYLNLHKLGGVGQKYIKDYFGSAVDNPVLSADRLVVNWWTRRPLPQARTYPEATTANEVTLRSDGLLVPETIAVDDSAVNLLEIPMGFMALNEADPSLGQVWRTHIREGFQALLAAGYLATDFLRSTQLPPAFAPRSDDQERVFYVFTLDDSLYKFN